MHLKTCSQNAEIKLSKVQTHNFDSSSQNLQTWRWNKADPIGRDGLTCAQCCISDTMSISTVMYSNSVTGAKLLLIQFGVEMAQNLSCRYF